MAARQYIEINGKRWRANETCTVCVECGASLAVGTAVQHFDPDGLPSTATCVGCYRQGIEAEKQARQYGLPG